MVVVKVGSNQIKIDIPDFDFKKVLTLLQSSCNQKMQQPLRVQNLGSQLYAVDVPSSYWCLGEKTWNRPENLAASSVNVAKIWDKPAACLASGISETLQGHQYSTRISSGGMRLQWLWPEGGNIHECTCTLIHATAQTYTADTTHTHSDQQETDEKTCLHVHLLYSCIYCISARTQPPMFRYT